jgi:hypothetical protein
MMLVVTVNAILFHAMPRFSRPDILFAVTVPDAFVAGEGRMLVFRYRAIVWSGAAAALAIGLLTDGGSRRLPAPVRGDDVTISGDGWTFRAAAGWVVREGARRGDYEVVRQQP